jgi:hypothetical protein
MGRGKFNILHAWDVAGVAHALSRAMDNKFGTRSTVLMRKSYDPFGFTENAVGDGVFWYYIRLAANAINSDIIHVHFTEQVFNVMCRLFPKKPIIMHYHGSDIRSKRKPTLKGKPAHIFYSTKDLARYFAPGEATWCPNPVDRKIYKRLNPPRSQNSAVSFNLNKVEETKLIAKKFGLELDILERRYHWMEIPGILSNYNYYLDIKEDPLTHEVLKAEYALSLTALQALSIGLKVIDANERIYDEFPEENDSEQVAERVYHVYEEVSKG